MSDEQKLPEGLDEFLASPEAAPIVNQQSYSPFAKAADMLVGDGPMDQQGGPGIPEAGLQKPLIDPIDLAGGAIAAELAPSVTDAILSGVKAANFKAVLGNEVGAIRLSGPSRKPIFTSAEAGNVDYGVTKAQRLANKVGITPALAAEGLNQQESALATSLAGPVKKYAKGGAVKASDAYAPIAQPPVSGFPVSAQEGLSATTPPPGLEEFIGGHPGASNSVPEGLDDFISGVKSDKEEKYGTGIEMGKAALEGAAQGLLGPLAPAIEKGFGVKDEDILGRAEVNPITHYGSEIAGLVGPALVSGGSTGVLSGLAKFTQAGALEAVGRAIPGVGSTLASKIGLGAAKAAIDNALVTGSDEVSKMILNDPSQSAETAIANIGLGTVIGGALGGGLGAGSELWQAAKGSSAGKLIEDFKGRVNEHITNPDPVSSVSQELGDYYGKISELHDSTFGPNGIKAQNIDKVLPELNQKIATHAQEVYGKMESTVAKMAENPQKYPEGLTAKLQEHLGDYNTALSKENLTSGDVFNATQDLKKVLQEYAAYDKHVSRISPEYSFIKDVKGLASELRTGLEDSSVWGKAGKIQQDINSAFTQYQPALKDFEAKFTSKLGGTPEIDSGKINTYINQLGKPNAELKQSMLDNFLKASEKYKSAISDSYASVGLESPVKEAALTATKGTLGQTTTGGKLADAFIDKVLKSGSAAGTATGASIGALFGGHTGAAVGAIVGEKALSPFFNSVLPGIAKKLLSGETSPQGLRSAVEYGVQVAKGESMLDKAVKNIFKSGSALYAEAMNPKHIERLDKALMAAQGNPDALMNRSTAAAHYLPDHAMAMDQAMGSAITYLNTLRPDISKKSPLDSAPIPNTAQKAIYNNALVIANNPTVVLDRVKDGSISQADIQVLGNLYPSLYNRMKEKIVTEMVDAKSKGEVIPYKTRVGMSMFLAQPLDSSMTPVSIMAAQIGSSAHPSEQGADSAAQQPKGTKSAPALQKMPGMYQTESQARVQRQQKQ